MPLKSYLDGYQYNADGFDFEEFKKAVLDEATADEGVSEAKITALTETATQTATELQAQKVKNYDLLQKIPADAAHQVPGQREDTGTEPPTIDSFFGKKE